MGSLRVFREQDCTRVKEGEMVYDFCWFPYANEQDSQSFCFLTTARSQPIHLWDAKEGSLRASYRCYDAQDEIRAANSVAVSCDGRQVYSGSKNCVYIFDITRPGRDYSFVQTFDRKDGGVSGLISTIALPLADPKIYAIGAYSGNIGLYSTEDNTIQLLLDGHISGVTKVMFSGDGYYLYSGARTDPTLVCWDIRFTVEPVYRLERDTATTNQKIQFDIEPVAGRHLITGGESGKLRVFDLKTGEQIKELQIARDVLNGVAFHPWRPLISTASGQRHFSRLNQEVSADNALRIFSFSTNNQLTTLPDELANFTYLRILRLKYNSFTALPTVLCEFKHLVILELSGNQITELTDWVQDLVSIKELDLSGNFITHLPETLCQIPRLEVLHLEHNRIEELPENLGSLKTLIRINLSTNGLRKLPKSMASMKQLQRINCANNLLTTIPSEFGFIKTLKEFNLRSNNLDEEYKAKTDEGLSRFLAFLRDQHETERLAEIERLRPVGTQVGSYLEYRCKSDEKEILHTNNDITCIDNRCWIRTGCTICQIENSLYLFGGSLVKDGILTNDLFSISIDRMEWKLQTTKGEKPCSRYNHICVSNPGLNSLVVFGGKSESNRCLNDLYSLDLDTMTWTKIAQTIGGSPSPRECASTIFWTGQLVLFGGFGSGTRLNDFWFLNLSTMTWSQPALGGTAPSPRQSAALCVANSTQLLLHGGRNHFVLDDLFVYDTLSQNWYALQTTGRRPSPRYGHWIHCFEDFIYLFGGFDELGAASQSMYRVQLSSDVPLTQQVLEWEEWDSQLEPNSSRICLLNENWISAFQVGSHALGMATNEAIEKGTVQWNVYKTAKLNTLQKKPIDGRFVKPKNPKQCRIQHTLGILSKMPKAYTIQTPKEQRAVEYAERFQEEFFKLYRHRRTLFLTPENECGVKKLICTSIRPTKTHYTELHNLDGISRFVSDFIQYETLEDPLHPPSHLVSPTSTLKWQAGDAFDVSILLASLLIGVGYDAYVCVGYGPKFIVMNDQSEMSYGYNDWDELAASIMKHDRKEENLKSAPLDQEKYKPRVFCPLAEAPTETENLETLVAPEQKGEIDTHQEPSLIGITEEEEVHDRDPNAGKYFHAWVMLAPSREISERVMVEPSTGIVYKIESCPYEGIEAICNHENYWICMQMPKPHSDSRAHPNSINYNLEDLTQWEQLFPTQCIATLSGQESALSHESTHNGAELRPKKPTCHFEAPFSWVMRLQIPQNVFDMRCPRGQKVTTFKNCQYEKFAYFGECARWDGIIDRITYSLDKQPFIVDQKYERRRDKLSRRCCKFDGESIVDIIEIFDPGNSSGLKLLRRQLGKKTYIEFYPDSRLDGLISREELIGTKIIDTFIERDDRLIYRSLSYLALHDEEQASSIEDSQSVSEIQTEKLVMRKITEKFERDFTLDCDLDIAKRVFYLTDNRIRLDFHFGEDRITKSSRIFHKDGQCQITQVNPLAHKLKPNELLDEYNQLVLDEKNCLQLVRDMEKEMKDLLNERQQMDLNVKLRTPYYDAFRDSTSLEFDDEKDTAIQEESDSLRAFMPKGSTDEVLSKNEALLVRERCLRALKERLIERANIMQTRLEEETTSLNKSMASYQRDKDQMTLEQVAEHESIIAGLNFRSFYAKLHFIMYLSIE
eukprot:g5750.t1